MNSPTPDLKKPGKPSVKSTVSIGWSENLQGGEEEYKLGLLSHDVSQAISGPDCTHPDRQLWEHM